MTIPPSGTIAPLSRRVVAFVIDGLIAFGLAVVLGVLVSILSVAMGPEGALRFLPLGTALIGLAMVAWMLVYTAMQAGAGSIGMRAQRLRLAREHDGERIGFGAALLRNLIFGLTGTVVIGYFSPLFDTSGRLQGWHDKVARTLVLEARPTPKKGESAVTMMSKNPPVPIPPRPGGAASAAPAVPAPLDQTVVAPPRPPAAPPAPPVPPPAPPVSAPSPAVPVPPPAPPAPAPSEQLIAFVPGVTQTSPDAAPAPAAAPGAPVSPPPPAPAAPPAPAPVSPPAAPVPAAVPAHPLDQQAEEDDVEATRISVPGHRLVFTWDDGTRTEVSRRTIFGRNPAAEAGALVVPVRDETLSLSKTHFEAGAEAAGGWVLDRHSTNGMTIVRGGERIVCPPGEKVRVRLGDAVEIGDRIVTIGGYA